MLETNIIRALFKRENYLKYRNFISEDSFDKTMKPLLKVVDVWYKNNTSDLDPDDFVNYFFADTRYDLDFYKGVINNVVNKPSPESAQDLLESFRQKQLAEKISVTAYEVAEGKKSPSELAKLLKDIEAAPAVAKLEYVTNNLQELLNAVVLVPGLRWRLKVLNRALGSLRKGNFGYIFARPETGKTTFLASEVSYMASQLKPEDPPILWFNNEEVGENVNLRIYEAVLGASLDQLKQTPEEAAKTYQELTKGKLLVVDKAPMDKRLVEAYIDATGASLVVIDQLDKIHGFKADRDDIRLGEVYIWARELAKRYCPVIGVCQADATAEGQLWLNMGHTANSKTSKSAEADWIVGIGRNLDPGYEEIRGLSVIKNKLVGDADTDPAWRHVKQEVLIKPLIARYVDVN